MAEYTATENSEILEAMKRHFLRRPITDAYEIQDLRIIFVRQSAEIESVLWLCGQTRDKRIQARLLPRDPCRWLDREAEFTPKVGPITPDTPLGDETTLTLVPYCTTRLRIAIFPKLPK